MGYAWPGFRRVRRQVCKRIGRRLLELRLGDLEAYRRRLEAEPVEWRVLDGFCRIPISRFGRDWAVFECLGREVLPRLAGEAASRGGTSLRAWSVGCARGEEPYTLSAVWRLMAAASEAVPSLSILATDVDEDQLARARAGFFNASSLGELPPAWREAVFERNGAGYRIRDLFREGIRFERQDVRETMPGVAFDLILCRNLVLTYLAEDVRDRVLRALIEALVPGGAFVIGARERMPPTAVGLDPWAADLGIYRRAASAPG